MRAKARERVKQPPVEPATADSTATLARIRSYYDQTWFDYRFFWVNGQNQAMHFGYWDEHTRSHAQSLIDANRVLADRIGVRSGHRLLDAGCGVGGSAVWLAKTYDVEVVGITPVASQVARARRLACKEGVSTRVSFEEADYTRTGFPAGSFDVVWAMESLCHCLDKRRFFAEARRLLRSGGRLGIMEYLRTARQHPPDQERLLHSWLSDWAIPDLATRDELLQHAQEAGFGQVEMVDVTPHIRPSSRRLCRVAGVYWPWESGLRALRLRSSVQHGNISGARLQYRALQNRLWAYGLLTATAS